MTTQWVKLYSPGAYDSRAVPPAIAVTEIAIKGHPRALLFDAYDISMLGPSEESPSDTSQRGSQGGFLTRRIPDSDQELCVSPRFKFRHDC